MQHTQVSECRYYRAIAIMHHFCDCVGYLFPSGVHSLPHFLSFYPFMKWCQTNIICRFPNTNRDRGQSSIEQSSIIRNLNIRCLNHKIISLTTIPTQSQVAPVMMDTIVKAKPHAALLLRVKSYRTASGNSKLTSLPVSFLYTEAKVSVLCSMLVCWVLSRWTLNRRDPSRRILI